jgi:hypothetical protein
MYGDRIERLVLFGSRARGDPRVESDYDVSPLMREIGSTSVIASSLRPRNDGKSVSAATPGAAAAI